MSGTDGGGGGGGLGSGGGLNHHADVMDAEPQSKEEEIELVEEIKRRAKGSFGAKHYAEAEALYSKALTVWEEDAVLRANRAAARVAMHKYGEALTDAQMATRVDATYSKGWFRQGQALMGLQRYEEALSSFDEVLKADPQNKSAKREKAEAERSIARIEADSKAESTSSATSSSSSTSATTTTSSTSSASSASSSPSSSTRATQKRPRKAQSPPPDDDGASLKPEDMRGYKTLEDGRKTTYFNRELSAEAKALIGDTAPQPIDPSQMPDLASGSAPAPGADNGGVTKQSAWNAAGTWEERNMLSWTTDQLRERMRGICIEVSGHDDAEIVTEECTDIDGLAQITMARGKKRRIMDMSFSVPWILNVEGSERAKGKLKLMDVTSDGEFEIEVEFTKRPARAWTSAVDSYVRQQDAGLQQEVLARLSEITTEFCTL